MKRIFNPRRSRIGLLLLALGTLGFLIRGQFSRAQTAPAAAPIPPEGKVAEIDTGGQVPGNPDNAVQDMRELLRLIKVYQDKHGRFPQDANVLWQEVSRTPQEYGFSSVQQASPAFTNPDARYSDWGSERRFPDAVMPYYILNKRLDGTLVGSPKAAGQRDVYIYTALYTHHNVRHFQGERSTENPVGFFVVMWDDGSIERVPYDQRLYAPYGPRTHAVAFRGQAGLPAGTLTYDQYYHLFGWQRGPRGRVGGRGQSYNGSTPGNR